MNIYQYSNYKKLLKDWIKKNGRRGSLSAIAKAIGCSHSYLSQVLSRKPELTLDQSFALTKYLGYTDAQTEFFLALVQISRASTMDLKNYFLARSKNIATIEMNVKSAIEKTQERTLKHEDLDRYYLDWKMCAVHILASCKGFQSAQNIAKRLQLDLNEVNSIVTYLQKLGLLKISVGRIVHSSSNIHLPGESPLNRINNFNWRMRAYDKQLKSDDLSYTSVFSIDEEDLPLLKAHLLEFISSQRKTIENSGTSDGFVFCCDLFRI